MVARTVSLVVDEIFLSPGNALDYCKLGHILSCCAMTEEVSVLAAMTHLAGLCIDGPTRDSDGCGLVHKASLCDDAQEGHGRHG
jgi:hypothetical protein